MWQYIRIFIAACLYYLGIVPLARWWAVRSGRRLVILGYHRATEGDLRRHLLYLRRHYRILPLETALKELYEPGDTSLQGKDRRPPLAITFDDGYYDNFTCLRMLVCDLQIPVTIFPVAGYIETGRRFWWLEPNRLVSGARVNEVALNGHTYRLARERDQDALATAIDAHLRHATSVAEREEFLKSIRRVLKALSTGTPDDLRSRPLTWPEVRELEASGYISFGAHTVHHPVLAALADVAELQHETYQCRAIMEQQLGHPVLTFAYPIGKMEDIGSHAPQAVKQSGYKYALTTIPGFNTSRTCPHLLRRTVVGGIEPSEHWLVMAAEAAGVWRLISRSSLSRVGTRLLVRLRPAKRDVTLGLSLGPAPLSEGTESQSP